MLNTLANYGTALYVHKALTKQAENAKEAVDYLQGIGLLRTEKSSAPMSKRAATYYFERELEPGVPLSLAQIRVAELTPEEKEALKKQYGLSKNTSLEEKSESRGRWARRLGGAAGALGGGILGTLGVAALTRSSPEFGLATVASALLGGRLGGKFLEEKATKKYSLEGLKKALDASKEKSA